MGDRKLDEFASIFRSAVKDSFRLDTPSLEHVVVVTDDSGEQAQAFTRASRTLLSKVDSASNLRFTTLDRATWVDGQDLPIRALLAKILALAPDLVVTERHLLGRDRDLPHTLGSVVDTLTQVAPAPVLLLPSHPTEIPDGTARVLVVTDHLTGDDRLVNWGVEMTWRQGTIVLAHVEDDAALDRYVDAISRIRDLDSDKARVEIPATLLERATAYIASIARVLRAHGIDETVIPEVRLGHRLRDWLALIDAHDIDLVVLTSRDAEQDAMHPIAHALAVQVRNRPLLLL